MVNSREKFKDYFLKVYVVWAIITPVAMILINAYINAEDQSIWDAIPWSRVPALLALFGLIWPLTIVISPAFYQSFARETGYSFFEALVNLGEPDAVKMLFATIIFLIAWIGPVVHFVYKLFMHKAYISSQSEDEIDWYDYIAGFI